MARLELVRCPSCRREVPWEGNPHRPFCSERCRVVDLGNWASESYRVPGDASDPDDASDEDVPPEGSEQGS